MDELNQYRENWKKNIRNFSDEEHKNEIKEKIIEATKNIEIKVTIDNNWSRYIGLKLWKLEYILFDPNLKNYIDDEYKYENYKYRNRNNELDEKEKGYVSAYWMWWDDTNQRKNQKLKKYINEKQWEWLHIAKIEEIKNILKELWKLANIDDEHDQIAMFMYLTGINWYYWLSMWDNNKSNNKSNNNWYNWFTISLWNSLWNWPVRSALTCSNKIHSFASSNYDGWYFASILMIS